MTERICISIERMYKLKQLAANAKDPAVQEFLKNIIDDFYEIDLGDWE